MLLSEPQETPADFHFRIGQIPVRVTGWFWPAVALFGWGTSQSLAGDDTRMLLIYLAVWVVVVFCSILVHELGHAVAFAACGQSSRIVLYHFGGLAVPTGMPAQALKNPSRRLIVSAAGPVAQLCLAIVVITGFTLCGYRVPDAGFLRSVPIVGDFLDESSSVGQPIPTLIGRLVVYPLLFVNIGWALLNLLPVQPLDGGHVVLESLNVCGVSAAEQISNLSGLLIAGTLVLWAYQHQETYLMFLFGFLCVGCYQRLVANRARLW